MNALPIVKFWRVWVLSLVLACLGAPALAWDDALIQAVYSVAFGRATEAQKALVFANNKVVNQMAMTNIIDNKAYQASQKLFSDINNTFIQKAAKEAGLKAGLQTPSGEGYNPGTDTDVLVDSAREGEKITLENIKKAEEAYQRNLRQFLENRGVKPPAGKIDTQTDFMPNSRSTTPSEFTKINQHINANGGTAYESPGAADVEWKMRLDKNDPLRKLNINETGEYMNEMQRLAKEKLGHAEALEAEARQALKTDPAKARGLQSDAQLARSQAGKYMQRMEKVSNELAKQHGVPGVPKSEGPLGQSIENISKEGRGFDTRGDARNIGKYGEAGVNKGVKDYAETLSKIAAKSKDPKAIAEAQRLIAEQTKNMKPDMREYIAKKAKEAFKGEGKAAEEFEKGLTKEMDKQAAKASAEGAGKGGTEGAAKGGTEGAAKGGTEGAAKGGTEGAAKGGTEGAAKGGTEGAAQGGTEGAAKGGTEGAAKGGTEGAAKGGTEGAAQGGTEGAAKGGTEGAAKGGTEGAAKGGTEGAAQGGTEGAAKGGTEGAAKGGTEGAAKGGTEGAAKGGAEGAAEGGAEGAASGLGAKVKTGLKILGPLLILHDGSGKITQAWKAKDTDKPQVAIEGGSEFVGATTGAMLGAAKGAALGAAIGTAVPVVGNFAGGIIGGILGGVAGYMGGGMAGRAAGEELANALGVKQDAYMPELMANADQLYKGLLAKGVPPDQALEAAKLFLGGRLGDFAKYMGQLRAKYGPKGGYVTSHHSQKDWYCTNRPEILAPVLLPPILQLMGMPPVPVPLPLPPAQGR